MRQPDYRAFLLRIWLPATGEGPHASVREVETGETRAFGTLEECCEWLARETNPQRRPSKYAAER